jgi:CheY-like chemotaxis protein
MTKILVIDDSDMAREVICRALRGAGYEVIALSSAIGATRAIRDSDVRMLVVDVNMPGLSGGSLVEVLRMHPDFRDLRIVLVSGSSPDELDALRRRCGADAALSKSDLVHGLVPLIRRQLEQAAPRLKQSR